MDITLEAIDISDFDFDLFTDISPEPLLLNSRCEFKECIQTKINDAYFCNYHADLIHYSCNKSFEENNSQKNTKKRKAAIDFYTQCAVNKCKNTPADNSYLCIFHDLEIDELPIIQMFHCKKRGCHKIKKYRHSMCINHLK